MPFAFALVATSTHAETLTGRVVDISGMARTSIPVTTRFTDIGRRTASANNPLHSTDANTEGPSNFEFAHPLGP